MENLPSTSQAPLDKRPRLEEELKEEGNTCEFEAYKKTTVESIIYKIISFFSIRSNMQAKAIETRLIPNLLKDSVNLNHKKVDLTSFQKIDHSQLLFLYTIFKDATKLKVDNLTKDDYILTFLSYFENLKKLTIHINDHDLFTTDKRQNTLKIESLKIICNQKANNKTIKELSNRCPSINQFSLSKGILSHSICSELRTKDIISLKLTNVKILPQDKKNIISLIRNFKKLKKLKLVNTNLYSSNITFHRLIRDFLDDFFTQNTELESLSFTLNQEEDQKLENLLNLTELTKLKIYYSAQHGSKSMVNLLNILKYLPQVKPTFIEYYHVPNRNKINLTKYLPALNQRSIRYSIMIENCCKNATINQCSNYEKIIKYKQFSF